MKQFICLADQPWSPVSTRTQQLLARLKDAQILYFEPPASSVGSGGSMRPRRVRPNILVYSLPRLPELNRPGGLGQRLFERRLAGLIVGRLERHHFTSPVLWTTHPWQAALLDCLPYRGLIYDCSTFHPSSTARQEGMLAQAADVVFAASPGIMDHLSPCNGNIALIPNGVNYAMFGRTAVEIPPELAGITGPVLGWAGDSEPEPDFRPLEHAAGDHPEWTFLLSGPKGLFRRAGLRSLPNVRILEPLSLALLPDYVARFDVCLQLLPAEGTLSDVIPSRIFEYLSTGKPIVSMLWEDEVEQFPDVIYGAHTPEEFSRLCRHALAEVPGWATQRRRRYGQSAAWSVRAAEVRRILEGIGLY